MEKRSKDFVEAVSLFNNWTAVNDSFELHIKIRTRSKVLFTRSTKKVLKNYGLHRDVLKTSSG